MKIRTMTVVALTVALTAAPGLAQEDGELAVPDSVTPERVLAGSALFNGGTCTFCHAIGGRGSGRFAPDLSDVEWLHSEGDFDGIVQTIFWGVKKEDFKAVTPRRFAMNPQGGMNIDFQQVKQLAAYVWTISRPETHPFVAAQKQFIERVRAGELERAFRVFREARDAHPDHPLLGRSGLNRLGYRFMPERAERAQRLFELNAELHPDWWNAWDSLAESHMVLGQREEAIRLYEKSLELNPENDNAREQLAELRAEG